MTELRDVRIKRLLYQSWYRGCKETDKIIGYFCKDNIHNMTDAQLDELDIIMQQSDADIYAWVTGSRDIPDDLRANSVLSNIITYDVVGAIIARSG